MRILLILECTKLAYKRSRRIAAKYMNQIGRRTFENDLSEKALNTMYKELKEITSKNNSIICYKTTLKTKKILFKLGSQKKFNDDGQFMYKTSNIEPDFTFNFEQNYILKITEIAALFHDIGKSNKGFQLSLDYGIKESMGVANRYRHELISFYMLSKLIEKNYDLDEKIVNEKDLLTKLSSCFLEPSSNNYTIDRRYVNNSFDFFTKQENWNKFPIINSILWLVLTHHKLANSDIDNNNVFEFSEYIKDNYNADKNEYLKKFENFVKSTGVGTFTTIFTEFDNDNVKFLEDTEFNKRLFENFDYILKNYDYFYKTTSLKDTFTNSKMPSLLTLISRPSLVFSDYKASADKQYSGGRLVGVAYANTQQQGDLSVMCDTLLTHLTKTYQNVAGALRLFIETEKVKDFRNIKRNFISKIEEKSQYIPEKFLWQEKAKENLLKYQNDDSPFFGIIMAGTGCGKTRASLKFLTALNNKKLRITVGLGLRTLSCQTHKEYTKEIFNGLENVDNEIGLAVGTCLNNLDRIEEVDEKDNDKIIENNLNDIDTINNFNGSTAEAMEIEDDVDFFIDDNIDLENRILQVIAKTNKDKVIIDKPVVVMTIDNIMKAFKQDISSNLRYLMRIISSDFVLDEIDDYDTKDLISISCLIYMLGYFRRRVFISSATVTPEISKTLFDFYQSGVMDNLNEDKHIVYSFINENNVETYRKNFNKEKPNIFIEDLNKFTTNVYDHISVKSNRFLKHRLSTVEFKNSNTIDEANDILYSSIKRLHHFNEINFKEIKISTGFIKFNNVRDSQDFSIYIGKRSNVDQDYHVVWLNYHSHFMNLERFYIEDFLDSYMTRKSTKDPALHSHFGSEKLFDSEQFNEHIKKAKELNKSNLIFVLSTTNIIEVGRDHDYDWAIIEPSSIKSVVQSLGRVKRHRDINVHPSLDNIPKDYSNVLLFDRFFIDIKTNNKDNRYLSSVMAFPGIQTDRSAQLKDVPIFSLEDNFSTGGNIKQICGSLNNNNKYSSHSYTPIRALNNSIFKHSNYFDKLFNQSFLDSPNNKYLIHDEYELNDLSTSYSKFRLLTMEKFKQELYLNSDYSFDVISARYYLNNFKKELISKMSKDFYAKNEFRKSAGSLQMYFTHSTNNLMADDTILYTDFGQSYDTTFLLSTYKNKKKIFIKTKNICINKNNCPNYFFSNIYFNKMYQKIVEKHLLKDDSIKVKFTMLEMSLQYGTDYKFSYNLGIGRRNHEK